MRRLTWLIPVVLLLSLLVSSVAFAAPAQSAAVQGWGAGYWYTVRTGDTLFSISRVAGISPWAIASANGLANPNYIYCGQQLWIPSGAGWPPPPPGHDGYNRGCGYWQPVYFGDTLYSIAARAGVSWYAIASANGLYNTSVIYAGSSLWIPCGGYSHW
jgi:spore germination protein YaaH